MPIRPENKQRYPTDWKQVSQRIRERSGGRCERCGAVNYEPHPITGSKVVLTVAHLDHQPENCEDENLKAMCQRCHLGHDIEHHRQQRIKNRREFMEASGQKRLFE